jgi:FkbM family methyltransferase
MQYPKLRFVKAAIPFLGKQLMIVDIASFRFMEQEIFCKQIYKFTCKNPQPFIIDAGANIGLSVIYFKQLYPDCEILAFEPDKNVFDALRLNVQSFGLNNVELIPKALWDELTTLQFYAEGADGGRIAVHGESAQLDVVPTIRLRQFLNRKVDFLKIDIEGAEIRVLEDCKDLLNNVERIFLEYHSFKGEEQSLHRILDILQGAGFRYNIKHTGVFSNHPFEEINSYMGMDLQLNIFAYRL